MMKFYILLAFYINLTPLFFALSKTYNDECQYQNDFVKANKEEVINNHIIGCGLDKETVVINAHQEFPFKQPKNDPICLKCAMCLAVAREVVLNLKPMINRLSLFNPKLLEERILNKIDNLCSTGFLGYGLKKYKCYGFISENYDFLKDVAHELDGSWIYKLRRECKALTKHINMSFLINQVSRKFEDIPEYLCYGSGVFSSCSELDFEILNISDSDELLVSSNSRSLFYTSNCKLK